MTEHVRLKSSHILRTDWCRELTHGPLFLTERSTPHALNLFCKCRPSCLFTTLCYSKTHLTIMCSETSCAEVQTHAILTHSFKKAKKKLNKKTHKSTEWRNVSSLIAWRQTLMKLLRWPSLRMLETPCCLATFWRISRRLSLGSEKRRLLLYRTALRIQQPPFQSYILTVEKQRQYSIRPQIQGKKRKENKNPHMHKCVINNLFNQTSPCLPDLHMLVKPNSPIGMLNKLILCFL